MSQISNQLKIKQDEFTYILNKEDKTAKIFKCISTNRSINICRSINYENHEYIITSILSKSFQNSNVASISFSANSELKTIEKGSFTKSSISHLTIPSSVVKLEEGWCKKMPKLNKVEIVEGNKHYKNYETDFVIGKDTNGNEEFNDLIFVNRNATKITIPPFIKRISSYSISDALIEDIFIPSKVTRICNRSFYHCLYLHQIEFSQNSELQVIEEKAFKKSRIKRIKIPSSVVELKGGSLMNLVEVQIMEGNKSYKNHEKFVIGKTDKDSEVYDLLVFASWKDQYIKIPPFIKHIGPYAFYKSSIRKVVIPSNTTIICKRAFYCSLLKMIQFQQDSQLQIIEDKAFYGSLLESIIIPDHVTFIGKNAFGVCSYLQMVEFSQKSELQIIEKNAFQSTKITKITIPSHVKKIGRYAFNCCFKLKSIEFSKDSELEIIETAAFGNTEIESLKILSNKIELKNGWCSWTPKLNSVEISQNSELYKIDKKEIIMGKESIGNKDYDELIFVNRDSKLIKIRPSIKRIMNYSFSDSLIEHITIPSTVKEICDFAFRSCKRLRQIQFLKNSELQTIGENAFEFTAIDTIVIPPHITRIRNGTFRFCSKLQKVTFSDDSEIQIIESSAFEDAPIKTIKIPSNIVLEKGCFASLSELTNIIIFPNQNQENIIYYEDSMIIGKSDRKSDNYDFLIFVRRDIENIKIPSFIKRIASHAFQYCRQLQKIEFDNISEIQIIDDYAFADSSIELFIMPPNVTQICEKSFYFCDNLRQIEFTENSKIKAIENNAFSESSIEQIDIPSHVAYIGEDAFGSCEKLKQVSFSVNSELHSILSSSFRSSSIKRIKIPSHVTSICKSAFDSCRNLRFVEFAENSELKIIEDNAFYKTSIEFIRIPNHVTRICESAFSSCQHLKKVELAKNSELQIIEKNAFSDSSIESITIPSSTIYICLGSFSKCKNLRNVEFPDNSKLQTIEKDAFADSSIEKIKIPPHVKEIRKRTFFNCEKLKLIEFPNNSELNKINIFSFKSCRYISVIVPPKLTEISNAAFQYCVQVVIEIDENSKLKTITENMFVDNIDTLIFIPQQLRNIIS